MPEYEASTLIADLERVRGYLGLTYYRGERLTSYEHDDAVESIMRVQKHLTDVEIRRGER